MREIKVLIVDKAEIIRKGLARLLNDHSSIRVVDTASSGPQAIQKAQIYKPDVVLIDTDLGEYDFVEAIQGICRLLPETSVSIFTNSKQDNHLFSALKAGAKAYITKDVNIKDLVVSIKRVDAGEVIISSLVAQKMLQEFIRLYEEREIKHRKYHGILSKREYEVLTLVSKGATNMEIASSLFITQNTAKVHIRNILEKLHVRNRHQAAALALKDGLIDNTNKST